MSEWSIKPARLSSPCLNRDFVFASEDLSSGSQCVLFFSFSSLVAVSIPKILVVGRAVLGQPFKILCQSDTGSLPINYTLLKDNKPRGTTSVELPFQQALFTVTITRPDEISEYMCEAKNSQKEPPRSKRLNTTVIGEYSTMFIHFIWLVYFQFASSTLLSKSRSIKWLPHVKVLMSHCRAISAL